MSCGIAVILKQESARTFIVSAHLPHKQRSDCLDTWQSFNSELEQLLQKRRMHDTVVLLLDTNYELGAVEFHLQPNSADERGFIVSGIIQQFGFVHTRPLTHTWSNSRGSQSKIDYVLVSTPSIELCTDSVHVDSDFLLGCDHRSVSASFKIFGPQKTKNKRNKRVPNKCGQWRVNGPKALKAAEKLSEKLDLQGKDLRIQDLEDLSNSVSFRPKSYRYQDPPYVKDLIKQKRLLVGAEARNLGKDILRARAAAKAKWLTELLDKGSQGDFQAIAYFKKRQSVVTQHSNYVARAGGAAQAVQQLKHFYRLKYTPPDPPVPDSAMRIFLSRVGSFTSPPHITEKEVVDVLATCKSGKSCGDDGISYELLNLIAHTGLCHHLVSLFNAILFQVADIPPSWLSSRLTFIPKIPTPSLPSHLRPIVLSSTPSKLFTKILLTRLRPHFPPTSANQLACIPGSQTLDGSVCLQHLIHLSQEYRLPLIAIKLDISAAFDNLSHDALASFLALCGPKLESLTLLKIIVLSRVVLSMAGETWHQKLFQGLLQGSSYSAELFGRTLDHFLGFMVTRWSVSENTWIQAQGNDGLVKIFNLLYADDIILLATSFRQAHRLLEDVIDILQSIGLSLSLEKCRFLVSPDLTPRPIHVRGFTISPVRSFNFLGVLMGFDLNSQTVLSARLTMANNSFWGYYRILRRPGAPLRKRLHLLNTYVTSKWRWLSPCVRPITAVSKSLTVMHNTLLTSLAGLTMGPFVTGSMNWVTRRRASRMCAQALHHQHWAGVQAVSFFSYWGHASRIHLYRFSPISIVLRIRDTHWLHDHWRTHRRRLGYWPNSYRFIQLAWEEHRTLGSPPYWEDGASDRTAWAAFTQTWLTEKQLQPLVYYPDLERVELFGRSLLQVGEAFTLLPFRHVPVESPYMSSFTFVPGPTAETNEACIQVCSDGSHRNNVGGIATVFLSPYSRIEDAVVAQAKVYGPCTSTKAEIRASILALTMIRSALPYLGDMPVIYMTDSSFVLQVLEEQCLFSCHPHDLHQLLSLWHSVSSRVVKQHVRGHTGNPINTLADSAAKAALGFGHFRTLYVPSSRQTADSRLPQMALIMLCFQRGGAGRPFNFPGLHSHFR